MFVLSGPRNGPTNNRQRVHCRRRSDWLVKRPLSIPQAPRRVAGNDTVESIISQEHPYKKEKKDEKRRKIVLCEKINVRVCRALGPFRTSVSILSVWRQIRRRRSAFSRSSARACRISSKSTTINETFMSIIEMMDDAGNSRLG